MKSSLLNERAAPLAQQKIINSPASPVLVKKKQRPEVSSTKPEIVVSENQQVSVTKSAPVATPAVNNAAAMSELLCVGVINGLRNSTECY
jgi:hypothetical protein